MSINVEKIAEILQQSPTAEAFATYAACRERNIREGVSKLSTIRLQMAREGFNPIPQDMLYMFKELERAGIGQLKGDFFKWNTPIKTIGEIAENSSVTKVKPTVSKPKEELTIPTSDKELVVFFSNKRHVSITFPSDLTKTEVEFLTKRLLQENS